MQVDEILALLERKFINPDKQIQFTKNRSVSEIVSHIKSKGFIEIGETIFYFCEVYYFEEKIPVIQIDYNYSDQLKEDYQIWLYHQEHHMAQRFWLYKGQLDKVTNWLEAVINKYSENKWKITVEKERSGKGLHYYCYSLNTNAQQFYNIIFQFNIADRKVRGIFHCLYKDKSTLGILLEALLLLSYETAIEHLEGK